MKYPILGCMLLLSVAFAAWSGRSVLAIAAEKEVARNELEECIGIASEIEAFDQKPQLVSRKADLVEAVVTAAELSGFRVSTTAEAATNFGNSGYSQQSAAVTARGQTLPQITRFLQVIQERHPSVHLSVLSLDPAGSNNDSSTEAWAWRVVLTQYVAGQITPQNQ